MAREEEESSNDLRVDVALTCAVSLGRRFPKHMKIDLLPETCEMCSSQQAVGLLSQATQLELPCMRVRSSIHMHGAHSARQREKDMLFASPSLEHRFEHVACRFQTARRLKTKSTDEGSRHVAKEEVYTPQFFSCTWPVNMFFHVRVLGKVSMRACHRLALTHLKVHVAAVNSHVLIALCFLFRARQSSSTTANTRERSLPCGSSFLSPSCCMSELGAKHTSDQSYEQERRPMQVDHVIWLTAIRSFCGRSRQGSRTSLHHVRFACLD